MIGWNNIVSRHGLRVCLEKTEVMWVGQRWEDLEIHLEEKKLKQRDIVVYLGGAICGNGNSDTDICWRITTVAKAWRKVEGVIQTHTK